MRIVYTYTLDNHIIVFTHRTSIQQHIFNTVDFLYEKIQLYFTKCICVVSLENERTEMHGLQL